MTLPDGLDAAALRRDFDRTFATPTASAAEPTTELVAVRAAEEAYALRLQEIAALLADLPLRHVPSPSPALVGLVVHRGALVPVFGLARLLGHLTAPAGRWFLLLRAPEAVALAVDAYEGIFNVASSSLEPSARAGSCVLGVTSHDGTPRSVLDVSALVSGIKQLSPPTAREGKPQ